MTTFLVTEEGEDGRFAFAIHKDLNVGIKIVKSEFNNCNLICVWKQGVSVLLVSGTGTPWWRLDKIMINILYLSDMKLTNVCL